jgi:uncharacterized protein YdhG (YjbR/CyaY superfamily)
MVTQKFGSVDEYIASVPEVAQVALEQVRQCVKRLAPTSTERISYHMPTFELDGELLLHLSAFKAHISVFGVSGAMEAFGERLEPYANEKGSLRFLLKDPMPMELIGEIVTLAIRNATAANTT